MWGVAGCVRRHQINSVVLLSVLLRLRGKRVAFALFHPGLLYCMGVITLQNSTRARQAKALGSDIAVQGTLEGV